MSTQGDYDQAHHHYGRHCLSNPCGWHPGETRIPPPHWYPATLALTDSITCLGMEWAERVREAGLVTDRPSEETPG